jgi:hypothetical protein
MADIVAVTSIGVNEKVSLYDVTDPTAIVAKGTIALLNNPGGVFISGDYLYFTMVNTLYIYDISDPTAPVAKDTDSTNLNGASSVFVSGDYAYVLSTGNERLCIYDISNPAAIVAKDFDATNLDLDSRARVFVVGDYAYVTSSVNGRLCIFDISDPTAIVAKDFDTTNLTRPQGLYVEGSYAYVVDSSTNELCIFDISDPASIVAKGTVTDGLLATATEIYGSGNYMVIVSGDSSKTQFSMFNVSDKDTPVLIGSGGANADYIRGVLLSGKYILYPGSEEDVLYATDISLAKGMYEEGNLDTSATITDAYSISITGNTACVVSNTLSKLITVDISDPTSISLEDSITAGGGTGGQVHAVGDYAYVTNQNTNTFRIFDVSDASNIVAKDTIALTAGGGVFKKGDYAYAVDRTNDLLCIFDVSDVTAIVAKDTDGTNLNNPFEVYVKGDYAFVTSIANDTLASFDISDETSISAEDAITTNLTQPYGIYVSGDYAYVASLGNDRLCIFDISDPSNLAAKGYCTVTRAGRVIVSGNYAYVANDRNDIYIVDVTDKDNPVLQTAVTPQAGASTATTDIALSGTTLVACDFNERITTFDITNPNGIIQKDTDNNNMDQPILIHGPANPFPSGKSQIILI